VYEHRRIEISSGKHPRDVVKVVPYPIPGLDVLNVIRAHINDTTVIMQLEVMSGFLV
jgi:hypothetical protein